jgi:hypothetical protein
MKQTRVISPQTRDLFDHQTFVINLRPSTLCFYVCTQSHEDGLRFHLFECFMTNESNRFEYEVCENNQRFCRHRTT